MELIYKDESYKVVGACMEVYNEKGFGFHEAVYGNELFLPELLYS